MRLFIDIETVPLENPNDSLLALFEKKFSKEITETGLVSEVYKQKAGLLAEFGKIVCISVGYFSGAEKKIKSFCDIDEVSLLREFTDLLNKSSISSLVAHNGKGFDYPWLCRRMIINKIKLPSLLNIQGLKPWEINLEDTMEMWRFGQFSHSISLAVLCEIAGIPSPKLGMDGSQVTDVFYKEKDLNKISSYCEGDVIALMDVYKLLSQS